MVIIIKIFMKIFKRVNIEEFSDTWEYIMNLI